jgi:hypothetical protein
MRKQNNIDEVRATSARMNEYGAGLLQRLGYKEKEPPFVEEMAFFPIDYQLDPDEPTGGRYQTCYQQTWDCNIYEVPATLGTGDASLLDMDMVYGATVKEVLAELCKALGRPPLAIGAHEWELRYDERDDQDD